MEIPDGPTVAHGVYSLNIDAIEVVFNHQRFDSSYKLIALSTRACVSGHGREIGGAGPSTNRQMYFGVCSMPSFYKGLELGTRCGAHIGPIAIEIKSRKVILAQRGESYGMNKGEESKFIIFECIAIKQKNGEQTYRNLHG